MKNSILFFVFIVQLFCVPELFAAPPADTALKVKVRGIIDEVQNKSRQYPKLDDFGMKTVDQGKEVLALGPSAVYALSICLDNPDWKVRFWIVDILGYLENLDAKRPLTKVINNRKEKEKVRQQAESSLWRIFDPLDRAAERK